MKIFLVIIYCSIFLVLDFGHASDQVSSRSLSEQEIKTLLPCAIPLISKQVIELGFSPSIQIKYGDFLLERTDIEDPDGTFTLHKKDKKICEIELSLNSDIYFSGVERLLVLTTLSGSSSGFKFYRVSELKCEFLGFTEDSKSNLLVSKLLDQNDGSRKCRSKDWLPSAGMVKRDLKLDPSHLVKEYVRKDAAGEFLGTNDWWNAAVTCPDCMGGPDTFTLISGYKIRKINQLEFEVEYRVEGTLSNESFLPDKKVEKSKFALTKTRWGYKLHEWSYQMVRADIALKRYEKQLNQNSIQLLKQITFEK